MKACISWDRPWLLLTVLATLCSLSANAAGSFRNATLSLTPPRGWNSYDSFSWIISEEEFLENAQYVAANLLKFGYEYVVVDFLWYRKHDPGVTIWTSGYEVIDAWGRLMPDPDRWPSTRDGKGFKPIADKVHAMGLKFGIHVMRGISTAAVESNTPILGANGSPEGAEGRHWTAKDIAIPGGQCSWMPACFTKVNTSTEGGHAFIHSLYQQYAEWGVDFIKHDCVFGVADLNVDEILAVSEAIDSTQRPMVYSLSPGVAATPEMAKQVSHLAHMYRVTADDWDSWNDVLSHFSVARDFAGAGLIGAPGLQGGKSWPDLDMLPIGWLTDPGAPYGPYRSTYLTRDEQRTQITLWAIAKSPLMFGGDLRKMDPWTLDLITQPVVLELNSYSTLNREIASSVQAPPPQVMLEDCASPKITLWELTRSQEGQDELCWSLSSRRRYYSKGQQCKVKTRCFNWKDSLSTREFVTTQAQNSGGERGKLWSCDARCLEPSGSLTNETTFSRCNDSSSQVWHLTGEGNLVNEENGLCAFGVDSTSDWKVWVARGSEGQSYVAFFNLGSQGTSISVAVKKVLSHLKGRESPRSSRGIFSTTTNKIVRQLWSGFNLIDIVDGASQSACTGLDVWKNETLSASITGDLEVWVESHGTVLVDLRCPPVEKLEWAVLIVLSILVVLIFGCYSIVSFSLQRIRKVELLL